MADMTKLIIPGDTDILLIVDLQNDFCAGGALAVPGGDEIVPIINKIAGHFAHVLLTQDWHPLGHHSFASAHPGRRLYETIRVPYGEQVLWPDHCVQGTRGAEFHQALSLHHAELVLRKGYHRTVDSYSASRMIMRRQGSAATSANEASYGCFWQVWPSSSACYGPPKTPADWDSRWLFWKTPAEASTTRA